MDIKILRCMSEMAFHSTNNEGMVELIVIFQLSLGTQRDVKTIPNGILSNDVTV